MRPAPNLTGTVEFTVKLPLIQPTSGSSGEKLTLIVHVPPPGIRLAQPVALNGGAVASVTPLCAADWLFVSVSCDVLVCPWNVDGNVTVGADSEKGTTLLPLKLTV